MGLTLRWDVPEEKVIVVLDNQKTFRIFENLFVNIQKYAMPQSRVYVQVHTSGEAPEEFVEITIKNMSATELNFDPEEITERFVRGDTSRGTEGSGLGLAIARSFTEAQGGKLTIEVDGDLFKVVIRLKCGTLQVEKEMEV
jgi:signal transduction histidine kinase